MGQPKNPFSSTFMASESAKGTYVTISVSTFNKSNVIILISTNFALYFFLLFKVISISFAPSIT
jgi:hypothetical protein